jgi:hypothetical protein
MFTEWVLHGILLYVPSPSPLNFPQRYDFKGLTPNNYMDMDLSSFFGLNSRFGAVFGKDSRVSAHWVPSHLLNSLVYQRVTGGGFSYFLKTALRLCRSFSDHVPIMFRSAVIVALGELRVCAGGHD